MRKYSEKLFKGIMEGNIKMKIGNHKMNKVGDSYYLMYHENIIMIIDTLENKIIVDNCNYDTSSTTQAINSHLEALKEYTFYNEFKFYDVTNNKKFAKKIKSLFNKEVEEGK